MAVMSHAAFIASHRTILSFMNTIAQLILTNQGKHNRSVIVLVLKSKA